MDSYFKKYLKYKNKYLSLRNLYGGVDPKPVSGNLKMLSEITNYTKKVFIPGASPYDLSQKPLQPRANFFMILTKIFGSIPNFINTQYLENVSGFYQDPLIQFYNITNNVYHNYINNIGWSKQLTSRRHQDKIFPSDENYINIHLHEDIITNPDGSKEDKTEFIKGGNFIASPSTDHAPNGVLFYIEPITDELREILDREVEQPKIGLSCSFKYNGTIMINGERIPRNFRHVDEIMTFLPYGIENGKAKFKIWIYGILTEYPEYFRGRGVDEETHLRNLEKHTQLIKQMEERYSQLEVEQLENLNRISIALFGTAYEQNTDQFFIVPININFNKPPVFNLSYIELRDPAILPQLFLSSNRANYLDPKIITELKLLKSCITNREVNYHILDTSTIHISQSVPGGNLHCLIKQEMEIP
jgi:hypothetical protein